MNDAPPAAELSAETLRNRVLILEATLATIERECERALDEPAVVYGTVFRVAALTRQARRPPAQRPKPNAETAANV